MKPMMYLNFDGNCAEALDFYTKVLNAEVKDVFRNKHAKEADRMPGADDLILNAQLIVGGVALMASDAGNMYSKPQGFSVHLECDSAEEAARVWQDLSVAGEVHMPLGDVFWAEQFGMLTDRFGTPWMVSYTGTKWDSM